MTINTDGDDGDEPVFELAREGDAVGEEPTVRQRISLDSLFTPDALALGGLILTVLAAFGPFMSLAASYPLLYGGEPAKGWVLGPAAGEAGAGLLFALVSWWRAQAADREVPRLAGAAVGVGAAILVVVALLWYVDPGPQPVPFD